MKTTKLLKQDTVLKHKQTPTKVRLYDNFDQTAIMVQKYGLSVTHTRWRHSYRNLIKMS